MDVTAAGSYLVLVVTAAVLFYVAANDLKNYRVPNELVLALGGLFLLYAVLAGRSDEILSNVGFALLLFVFLLVCYAKKLMGGGDVKLLVIAFVWTGRSCALPFAIALTVFAAMHFMAAKLQWVGTQTANGRTKIAFGPSIAAALIITLILCVGLER